jgi:hypothetical protein
VKRTIYNAKKQQSQQISSVNHRQFEVSSFSTSETPFLIFKKEFREGTYTPQGGSEKSIPQGGTVQNPAYRACLFDTHPDHI